MVWSGRHAWWFGITQQVRVARVVYAEHAPAWDRVYLSALGRWICWRWGGVDANGSGVVDEAGGYGECGDIRLFFASL